MPFCSAISAAAVSAAPHAAVAPAATALGGCAPHSGPLVLAIGIITAPANFDRRVWIRQKLRVSEAACRGIRVLFVLGSRNHASRKVKLAVRFEQRVHGDIIYVPARDWIPHAVAEKSLAWWEYASANLHAEWYAKTDDDSLAHLPRLEADLRQMRQMRRSHYYYGVMTWRSWTPLHTEPDGGCGARGDDGPSLNGPSETLKKLMRERAPGGSCAASLGPYPFADGSLQVLSADLMHAFVDSPLAKNFSQSHRSKEEAPFWTHEDAGVGYLIFHNALLQSLPLTYVVLSAWKHNKFWINWFPLKHPSLPNEHVVNTHKVITPISAQIAHDAYENTTYEEDPIKCADCQATWGWQCCHETKFGRVPLEYVP